MLHLNVLGSMELLLDRKRLRIGGRRECVVLALLALRPDHAVSMDHLVDAVWGDEPPDTARAQIQSSVSKLRKHVGGPEAGIETCRSGYRLCVGDGMLDSRRFGDLVGRADGLVASGDATGAVGVLDEALRLWTGPAFGGIDNDVVRQRALVLDEARLSAAEERLRLLLELGRHEAVVGEVRALCADHPLRERLHGFLMLSLYRSGRQAEAVAAYRSARETLLADAGIEPGAELRELEHAILNRHTELDAPRARDEVGYGTARSDTPRQLPMSTADFVGRDDRIAEVHEVLSLARRSETSRYAVPVIAISGAGGVGKSALALRVAHELAERYPDGHLYADLRGDSRMENTHAQLARFLYALGFSEQAVPEDPQERAATFRTRLAEQRQLLVLDNVTAEHQVLPLLPGNPACAVIVTSRMRLSALPGAHWIDLDIFDERTATEMLAAIVGRGRLEAEPEPTRDLVRYCSRLPLALRIAGTRLGSRPHWKVAELTRRLADEQRRLDEFCYRGWELRPSMALTYRSLPERAQRLFRLLSLPDAPDFSVWTAASLLGSGQAEAEQVLETLVDARLAECRSSTCGQVRYGFHDLVRVYARELCHQVESEAERREALGRTLGAWLDLAREAHRREYGGDDAILHGSTRRPAPPGETDELDATLWAGLETAPQAIVAAIRQAAALSMDELCWDLALTSVSLLAVRGFLNEWRDAVDLAYRVCERTGNRTGCAAMLYAMGMLRAKQKRCLGDAPRYFTAALDLFEAERNGHGQALVLAEWAFVDRMRGDIPAMLVKYRAALARMREAGDRAGEAAVLTGLAVHHLDERDTGTAESLLADALALCRDVGHLRGEIRVTTRFVDLYLATGRIVEAHSAILRVLREVRAIGDRAGEARALYGLATVRRKEGRLDSADTTAACALRMAEEVGDQLMAGETRHLLAEISVGRGEDSAAQDHLVAATELFGDLDGHLLQARSLALLADVHDSLGDVDRAVEAAGRAGDLLSGIDSRDAVDLRAALVRSHLSPVSGVDPLVGRPTG